MNLADLSPVRNKQQVSASVSVCVCVCDCSDLPGQLRALSPFKIIHTSTKLSHTGTLSE